MEYYEFSAMNTTVVAAAEGSRDGLRPGFHQVRRFVERSEQRFSRFRQGSELSRLNRHAGTWFRASSEMFELVKCAFDLHTLTGGFFDPSILHDLRTLGYDRSMDEIRGANLPPAIAKTPRTRQPFSATRFDPERQAIRLPAGTPVDLGGIAKGWIAAQSARILSRFSDGCAVSAGGDMALIGMPEGENGWEVSLEDPLDAERVLAVLEVGPGGLATSTTERRRWLQGGRPRHHIIDPRSGRPACSPWVSVTVHADSALLAEVFAKALLIAGPEQAPALASRIPTLQYAAVAADGTLVGPLEHKEFLNVPAFIS